MKRVLFCIFLCLFMMCGSALADTSIQPEASDLSKEQAVQLAAEQLLKATGLDQSALQDYIITTELYEAYKSDSASMPRRWQVVFTLKENEYIWLMVLIASPSGEFISAEPNDFSTRLAEYNADVKDRSIAIEQGKVWLAEKGPWWFWSYEEKAAFVLTYRRNAYGDPDTMTGLPREEDISLDQALSIAKQTIAEHFLVSQSKLSELKLNAQFIPAWNKESSNPQGAWILCFHRPAVNANGRYAMLYQANILSPGGAVEAIYMQDYQGRFDKDPVVYSWPPEGQEKEEPAAKTGTVYYNGRGGKFYHMDAQCSSIDPKYFPLTAIDMSKLSGKPYNMLLPCPVCVK